MGFTFIAAYGEQRGSANWRELNKIDLKDIYSPSPDVLYYRLRLGDRPEDIARQKAFRDRLLAAARINGREPEPPVVAMVNAICEGDGETLWNINSHPRAIPQLLNEIDLDSSDARSYAAAAIGRIGEPATAAIPSLKKLTYCRDPWVRKAATEALRRLEPAPRP